MTDSSSGGTAPDPSAAVLEALQRIEQRLERLEQSTEAARLISEAGPGLVATLVDTVDGRIERLSARGVDVDERTERLCGLIEKLTEPAVMDSLAQALELAKALPPGIAAATDVFDGVVGRLADSGIDVDQRLRALALLAEPLTAPEALQILGRAADALSQLDVDKIEPVGALGALKALGHRDTKQALGVLLALGKCFGASNYRTHP